MQRSFTQILKERLQQKVPFIQSIMGPRQVGKTTGLEQMISEGPDNLYHYVSGEGVPTPIWIEEQWQIAQEQQKILIIDEIQKIPKWSETIKKLWDHAKFTKKPVSCVIAGSSSLTLQKGLSESLAGRFENINVPHWNFYESQLLEPITFENYLKYGGYPGSYLLLSDAHRWQEYIRTSIVEAVISKDILMLAQVKAPALFRQAFYLLMNFPAQVVSYSKLLGQLQDKGNIDLVKYYIQLYEGAFLIKSIFNYSKNEIRKKSSSPKIITMAPALNTFHRLDNLDSEYMGRVFESLVGAQLVKANFEPYYWSDGNYEVDYVLEFKNQLLAIEVKSTRNKRAVSLEVFRERYPASKFVFINADNYVQFERNPREFLASLI